MPSPRNIRRKIKFSFQKEIIGEGTKVNVTHLIRSLPFSTKNRLCTIRKKALYDTLIRCKVHVRKSYNLTKLLEIAKKIFNYEEKLEDVNKKLTIFQNIFKKYYHNLELRLQGPGIPIHRCMNKDCPYTMELLTDIPKNNIFTWKDDRIYGCDFESLYQLISKRMEQSGKLYECKENEYRGFIDEYESLSRLTNKRRFRESHLGSITNPFTRSPFPGEAFTRILEIGKRRGLFSKEPQNRRIRRRAVFGLQSEGQDNEAQEHSLRSARPNVTELSTEVSEYLRTLEFYTPDTILTDIIQPVVTYSQSSSIPEPLDHAHSMRILTYITQSCIPILENLADHFTNSTIRNNINRRGIYYSFYRSFRQGNHIRMLYSHHTSIQELIQTDNSSPHQVSIRIRRYCRRFLDIWHQVFLTLKSLLTSENINIDDKKSIAIFIIISLAQSGFLQEGFEWATEL